MRVHHSTTAPPPPYARNTGSAQGQTSALSSKTSGFLGQVKMAPMAFDDSDQAAAPAASGTTAAGTPTPSGQLLSGGYAESGTSTAGADSSASRPTNPRDAVAADAVAAAPPCMPGSGTLLNVMA